jgi:hypothetical protein
MLMIFMKIIICYASIGNYDHSNISDRVIDLYPFQPYPIILALCVFQSKQYGRIT